MFVLFLFCLLVVICVGLIYSLEAERLEAEEKVRAADRAKRLHEERLEAANEELAALRGEDYEREVGC